MSWFFIQTEIPRRLFSFLHPPHRAWQHKQGLHPTEGTNKSLLQVEPTHIKRILTCWAIESKITQCAQILQLAVLPRSWNPAHSQSFPCHHLHVQANQLLLSKSSRSGCPAILKYSLDKYVSIYSLPMQAPKVWPSLSVWVLPEKTQDETAGKPACRCSLLIQNRATPLCKKSKTTTILLKRYLTRRNSETLP